MRILCSCWNYRSCARRGAELQEPLLLALATTTAFSDRRDATMMTIGMRMLGRANAGNEGIWPEREAALGGVDTTAAPSFHLNIFQCARGTAVGRRAFCLSPLSFFRSQLELWGAIFRTITPFLPTTSLQRAQDRSLGLGHSMHPIVRASSPGCSLIEARAEVLGTLSSIIAFVFV